MATLRPPWLWTVVVCYIQFTIGWRLEKQRGMCRRDALIAAIYNGPGCAGTLGGAECVWGWGDPWESRTWGWAAPKHQNCSGHHLLLFCWELITENDKMRPLKTLSLFPLKLLFLPDLGKAEVFCLLGGCRAKGSFGGERKGHEVATLSMKVIPFPAIASANWGSTPLAW